jgi:hypothetical protein
MFNSSQPRNIVTRFRANAGLAEQIRTQNQLTRMNMMRELETS